MFVFNKAAYTDELTGVWNRRFLRKKVKLAKYRVLYFVDIDELGKINKTQGFSTGDQVIRSVVKELSHLTQKDDIIVRIGGDEFIILSNRIICFGEKGYTVSTTIVNKSIEQLLQEASLLTYKRKTSKCPT